MPRWTKAGRELLFLRGDSVFAMAIGSDPRTRGAAQMLFVVDGLRSFDDYDATRDGQRILIRLPNRDAYARGIDVVLNWFTVLRNQPQGARP